MKKIIYILAVFFFISDCSADARVLEQLKLKSSVKAKKANSAAAKSKKLTKKVRHDSRISKNIKPKPILPKEIPPKEIPPKEIITKEDLDIKNDLVYLPNENKPFTGKHEQYHSNGKKYIETNYKDGKKNGSLTMWDEYEHKVGQLVYMEGELLE